MTTLRDRLWSGLSEAVPGLHRQGHPELCLPNTLNVTFPGTTGRDVLAAAPELAASTGSACHDGGAQTPSPVLSAMGIGSEVALGAVRLSLGRGSDAGQVDEAVRVLARAWRGQS